MKVQVLRAWPRRHHVRWLELSEGATVADAVAAAGMALDDTAGFAVFGERAEPGQKLREGDRVELLPALLADPKETRRRRARVRAGREGAGRD